VLRLKNVFIILKLLELVQYLQPNNKLKCNCAQNISVSSDPIRFKHQDAVATRLSPFVGPEGYKVQRNLT
jgi:hypothetical protein